MGDTTASGERHFGGSAEGLATTTATRRRPAGTDPAPALPLFLFRGLVSKLRNISISLSLSLALSIRLFCWGGVEPISLRWPPS